MKRLTARFVAFILLLVISGCATYYQANYDFSRQFATGQLEQAAQTLSQQTQAGQGKDRLLYFLNQGVVHSMLGHYELSNQYLEQAYLFGEDVFRNAGDEIVTLLLNPSLATYHGELHEHLYLLYYKALNYLRMGDLSAALVEARRMVLRLNALEDKIKSESKYRDDAFAHLLVGIVYDASGDYNNAFVAYKNAYDVFTGNQRYLFAPRPPEQLKRDLIRTAYQSGIIDQGKTFEKEFNMQHADVQIDGPQLVFFWNNGLGPVKSEWSINFAAVRRGGVVVFQNDTYGFSFPFPYDWDRDEGSLGDLRVFRVAFPRYVERPVVLQQAAVSINGEEASLYQASDVNAIAFTVLQQRMLEVFGRTLLRVAIKKGAEAAVRKESEGWGAVLGVVNAMTEKADTRNWQTLPHSIYYTRLPLEEGENNVHFEAGNALHSAMERQDFTFVAKGNNSYFHMFQSISHQPVAGLVYNF